VRTATVLAGGHSNQAGSGPVQYVDSEHDAGDEAHTAYTRYGDTTAVSIIGETSDDTEEWEFRSIGSGWRL